MKNGCMKIQPLRYTNITPRNFVQQNISPKTENVVSDRLKTIGALSLPFIICEIACRISKKLNSNK